MVVQNGDPIIDRWATRGRRENGTLPRTGGPVLVWARWTVERCVAEKRTSCRSESRSFKEGLRQTPLVRRTTEAARGGKGGQVSSQAPETGLDLAPVCVLGEVGGYP